jgi:hypothetical protein
MNKLRGMKFFLAMLVWLIIGVILGLSILLAAKGSFLLLGLSLVAFVAAVGKIGCAPY